MDISEQMYGEMAEVGNIEPYKVLENTDAVYGNMIKMGEFMEVGFQQVLEFIEQANNRVLGFDTRRVLREEENETTLKIESGGDNYIVEAIAAKYEDGILKVTLAKLEGFETVRKTVEID